MILNDVESMASINSSHNDEQLSFEQYKVDVWLDNQSTHTSTQKTRKRKRNESHSQAAHCPRNPLRETTMNSAPAKDVESDPPKRMKGRSKLPTHERGPRRVSPRKNAPTETDEAGYSRALQRGSITVLPRRGTASNSSTQSRSSSPVKTIHDLTMADPPITFFEANSKTVQPPQTISQLYKKVIDVSDGFNLLPGSLKVRSLFILSRDYANSHA